MATAAKDSWIRRIEKKWPDYDLEEVPQEARKPWYTNTFLWMAWTAILSPSLTGAAMATGMGIYKALWCIFIGNFVIACVAVCMGFIGRRMGLSAGQLCRYAFGTWGGKLGAVLMGGIMMMWSALDMSMAGQLGKGVFEADWGHFLPVVIILAVTLYAVLRGISGPAWIAYIAVPIVIIIYLITGFTAISQGGGWSVIASYRPEHEMPMSIGIMLVIAAWINGSVMAPNLVRVAKDWKGVMFGPPAGLLIIESANLFIGVVGMITLKAFGLSATVVALTGPLGVIAVIGCFIMFFKTNPTTTYASCMEWAAVFQRPKHLFVFLVVAFVFVASTLVTFVAGLEATIVAYLPWISATMTAVGGVIISDYFFVHRGKYPKVETLTQKVNWVGIAAFVVGTAVNMISYWLTNSGRVTGFEAGIPGVNGLVVSAVVHYLVSMALPKRYAGLHAETDNA